MANQQVQRLLEFANLQMAAEAFLLRAGDGNVLPDDAVLVARLGAGNTHVSRFASVQADQFTKQYEVLAQYRNDPQLAGGTGFSGTLFRNRSTGELTLSFRSTEFIDDAVRDNIATNKLEIKDLGWAFGQISEMEAWYSELKGLGGPLEGKSFNVTGYSLGGHLATAFNILRREEAEADGTPNPILNTYTFNGAGTGSIRPGRRLTDLLADFNQIRQDYQASPQWNALSPAEKVSVRNAAEQAVRDIQNEYLRVAGLGGVANPAFGNATAPLGIQATMDYQIAARLVGLSTVKTSNFPLPGGVNNIPSNPVFASMVGLQGFDNMIEVVGSDSGNLGISFVSNSGIHYGSRQEIYIESQPIVRGAFPLKDLLGANLLVSNPAQNDFGDTHSIVLLVDALSLLAAMESLDAELAVETGEEIFSAASSAKASSLVGTQGKAEGDTLERTLDALRDLVLGPGQEPTVDYADTLEGNTWHLSDLRSPFQENLAALNSEIAELTEENDFTIESLVGVDADDLVEKAMEPGSIAYRYALTRLNPFAVVGIQTDAPLYDQHNILGQLELYDPETGTGSITEEWIVDRAEMLVWKNLFYNKDGNVALRSDRIETLRFVDRAFEDDVTGDDLTLTVVGRQQSAIDRPSWIVFGSEESESLTGGDIAAGDHLYGGGGNDTLQGKQGNDYLEGGAGDDTYVWNAGDGFDTILDTDGAGKLIVDGVVASGGIRVGQNDYISPDKTFSFHLDSAGSGNILVINGSLEIKNFRNGDLGITFDDVTGIGQIQPTGANFEVPYHPWSPGRGFGTDGADHVLAADSFFVSKDGDDFLELVGDTFAGLDAGPGNDIILGTSGQSFRNYFFLGSGADIAFGGDAGEDITGDESFLFYFPGGDAFFTQSFSYSGFVGTSDGEGYWQWEQDIRESDFVETESQLFHGTISDALKHVLGVSNAADLAGNFDDYIDGGGGADRILGGNGSDTLFGGEGDDVLTADGFALVSDVFGTPVPAWLAEWAPFLFAPGDDYVDGGPGNDVLGDDSSRFPVESMGGSDVLIGGDGNDVLTNIDPLQYERSYFNVLDGGDGNDILSSNNQSLNGFDTLIGGPGDDSLTIGDRGMAELNGGEGNDLLTVGAFANAVMEGGTGSDFYMASLFDPFFFDGQSAATLEIVEAEDNGVESDTLSLSVLTFNDISMSITRDESNLYIGTADLPRWLTISDWFEGAGHKIETVAVAINKVTGSPELMILDVPAIESRFMVATDSDDTLWGSAASEQLAGGLGNDVLVAGDGDDTLEGGKGSDILDGGKGADRYVFHLGDGVDRIADSGGAGSNGILFGPDITRDMLVMDFDTLTLRVGEDGDAIELGATDSREGDGFSTIEYLQFSDGSTVLFQDFLGQTTSFVDADGGTGGGDTAGGPDAGDPSGNTETAGSAEQGAPGGATSTPSSTEGVTDSAAPGAVGGSNPDSASAPFSPGSTGTDPILTWWPEQGSQIGQSTPVGKYSMEDSIPGQQGGELHVDGGFLARDVPGASSYKADDRLTDQRQRSDLSELLESYLTDESRLDFDVSDGRTGQGGRRNATLTPVQVAHQWERIERYMKTLVENDDEDAREGAGEYRMFDNWNFIASADSGSGFGFAGSTGATRGMAHMRTLQGLSEGLVRLTA